jgi:hypothetical protein
MALTTVQAGIIGNAQQPAVPVSVNFGVPIIENPPTIASSYCISTGTNAMSAGPITINDGIVITIPDGSVWTIV